MGPSGGQCQDPVLPCLNLLWGCLSSFSHSFFYFCPLLGFLALHSGFPPWFTLLLHPAQVQGKEYWLGGTTAPQTTSLPSLQTNTVPFLAMCFNCSASAKPCSSDTLLLCWLSRALLAVCHPHGHYEAHVAPGLPSLVAHLLL